MSGHSKWSTIKHKKAKEDAKKGKVFSKLVRAITMAAREGGGNPEGNLALANALEKAKEFNLPADNIERAIKKGTGELEGAAYEQIIYEGYGPSGIAFVVETTTDNKNRTAQEVRHMFSKHGGNLGTSGSVLWMFERKGIILVPRSEADEETLMLAAMEAGAEDIKEEDENWIIESDPSDWHQIKEAVRASGIVIESAELTMVPKSTTELSVSEAEKVLKMMDALEKAV